ncbi:MAG: hypothetical protein ACYC54_14365 [Sedimentisphaerales bacterium]
MAQPKRERKSQAAQIQRVYHGNPQITLPCHAKGGVIYIICSDSNKTVWLSHKLPNRQALCIDVWDGRFCGNLEQSAVLPQGDYEIKWQDCETGKLKTFEHIKVADVNKLIYDFKNQNYYKKLSRLCLCTGDWRQLPAGIQALSNESVIFNKGSMHGNMSTAFKLQSCLPTSEWGLIARHYNAFNHLRLICNCIDKQSLKVSLAKYNNTPPDNSSRVILAETVIKCDPKKELLLRWDFNGASHKVWICDKLLFSTTESYMGGVDIIGLWSQNPEIVFRNWGFSTTQNVPRQTVETSEYKAQIRPGNIETLCFKDKGKASSNICWESGIQFGHIGGSEIKFTQRSKLQTIEDGPAVTCVAWQGPMPKFVEQSSDVRGLAYGQAYFYLDRIVIDDAVLPWVKRSVGPDLDIFKPALAGDIMYVQAGERSIKTWRVKDDGQFSWLVNKKKMFPIAMLLPLKLGTKICFLKVLILLRRPCNYNQAAFAWHCPSGIGASYDFRVAPNEPGVEHAFTIAMEFLKNTELKQAKAELLLMRDAWLLPAKIKTVHGNTIVYDKTKEQPKVALDFIDCFDTACGMYALKPLDSKLEIEFSPGRIARKNLVFKICGVSSCAVPKIYLNGTKMKLKKDFYYQHAFNSHDAYIYFRKDIYHICNLIFFWN